jgi:hypothetical protein
LSISIVILYFTGVVLSIKVVIVDFTGVVLSYKIVILYSTGDVMLSIKFVIYFNSLLFYFVYQGYNLTFDWCCFVSQECNFIISQVLFSLSIVILYSTGIFLSIKIPIVLFHWRCFVYQGYHFISHWCCFVSQEFNFIISLVLFFLSGL